MRCGHSWQPMSLNTVATRGTVGTVADSAECSTIITARRHDFPPPMWICRMPSEYRDYMNIRALEMLVCTLLVVRPLAAESIPFEVCAESTTWKRPSPEVQAKIWNDLRYKDVAGTAYAWTHNFIVIDEPTSASIPYHLMNTSGVWTATSGAFAKCYSDEYARRSGYEWIEVWALLHRVTH